MAGASRAAGISGTRCNSASAGTRHDGGSALRPARTAVGHARRWSCATRPVRPGKTSSGSDLRVSREFDVPVGSLLAYVELSNATDRRNPCCTDFDAELEDDGSLAVEQLNEYWWPRLPAIGFLWQF